MLNWSINRMDHVTDLGDVVALASVGPNMRKSVLKLECDCSLDGLNVEGDAEFAKVCDALDALFAEQGDNMEAAAMAHPDQPEDFPLTLVVTGLRQLFAA
jgi:hypothetical protein